MQMSELLGIIICVIMILGWFLLAWVFDLPLRIFAIGIIGIMIIIYFLYNFLIAPSVSVYFRLVKKGKHEWHLQKNITSFFLISMNSPHTALRILCRDIIDALFTAMNRIPSRSMIVVETHLFSPSLLRYFPIQPEYQEKEPKKLSKVSAEISLWLSSFIRFALGKGWNRPYLHRWYRLSIKKQGGRVNPGPPPLFFTLLMLPLLQR